MADTTVDKLKIEIDAEAAKAKTSVDDLIDQVAKLQAALGSKIDTKKLKDSLRSLEDFQERFKDVGKSLTFGGNLFEIGKEIETVEKRLDKLLAKEEKYNALGKDQTGTTYASLQYDIAECCNYLDTLYNRQKELENVPPTFTIDGKPYEEWAAQFERVQEAAQSASEQMQDIGGGFQTSGTAAQVENLTAGLREAGQDAEDTNRRFNILGGNSAFSRLAEKLKAVSIPNIFRRMSDAVKDFQIKIGSRVPTEQYTELTAKIQQAEAELQKLLDKQDRMEAQGINQNSASWKGLQYDIRVATDRVAEFNRDMELLQASGGDTQHLGGLSYLFKSIGNGAKSAVKGLKSAAGSVKSFIAKIAGLTGALSSARGGMGKLNASTVPLARSLFKVGNLLKMMVTRLALRAILNNVGEGFKHLAGESASFNAKISDLMASCQQLAHSIAALAEPIINIFGPALSYIINLINTAVNAVNQFLSAFTGKNVFQKAKKQNYDYAASLSDVGSSAKKAAKEIKDATVGIDELNIISQNNDDSDSGSGGGGGGAGGDYYNTAEIDPGIKSLADRIKKILKTDDWSEIGRMIAGKLNEVMRAIPWDDIQAGAEHIAKGIGTLINGFVEGLDWVLVGKTIGEGLNTAVIFANTLLSTIDFGMIGRSLAIGLNSAVNTINWRLIGETIKNGINAIINLAYEFVSTFNFAKFGESVGNAVSTAINGVQWTKGGASVGKAVTGLFNALNGFIKKTDFKRLGKGIVEAIGGFFKNLDWASIGNTFSSAFSALLSFLQGVVEGLNFGTVAEYIITAIVDFFKGFDWRSVSQTIGKLLGTALKTAVNSITSIWELLQQAWGSITGYFKEYIENAGGDIIAGLWNGIKNALKNVGNWIVENIFNPFVDGIKAAFGIASPAKEMEPLGGYIIEGLLQGITNGWKSIKEFFANGLESIRAAFSDAWDAIQKMTSTAWNAISDTFSNAWESVTGGVKNAWETIKNNFSDSWNNVKNGVTSSWTNIKATFSNSWNTITTGVKNSWLTICQNFTSSWNTVKNGVSDSWNNIKSVFSSSWSTVTTGVKNAWLTITQNFTSAWNTVKTGVTDSWNAIKSTFSSSWSEVIAGVKNSWTDIKQTFSNSWSTVIRGVSDAWTTIKTGFSTGMSSAFSSVKTGWENIKNTFTNGVSAIKSAITSVSWSDLGGNIVDGIWNGISSGWDWLTRKVKDLANSLYEAAKDALDINSPSRKFAELGYYTVLGFNQGLDENAKTTLSHVSDWVSGFSAIQPHIKARFNVDDSAIKNYHPNYAAFETDSAIRHTIQQEVNAKSNINAVLDGSGGFREALAEIVQPYLDRIADNTRSTADGIKEARKVSVEIDGQAVVKATDKARLNNGYSFTPQMG